MATQKIVAADLKVNSTYNPRNGFDGDTKNKYVDNIEEYLEQGKDINAVWRQDIVATKDLFVLQGCHTVLAVKQVDETIVLDVKVLEFNASALDGRKARAYAAHSNVHGLPLKPDEKRVAVRWALENMNLRREDKDPNLEPHISDRKLGTKLGISKSLVFEVRHELLAERGLEKPKSNPDEEVIEKDDVSEEVNDLTQETSEKQVGLQSVFDNTSPEDPHGVNNGFEEESDEDDSDDVDEDDNDDIDVDEYEYDEDADDEAADLAALKAAGVNIESEEDEEDPEIVKLNQKLAEAQAELKKSQSEKEKKPTKKKSIRSRLNAKESEYYEELSGRLVDITEGRTDPEYTSLIEVITKMGKNMDRIVEGAKPGSDQRAVYLAMRSVVYHISDRLDIVLDSE